MTASDKTTDNPRIFKGPAPPIGWDAGTWIGDCENYKNSAVASCNWTSGAAPQPNWDARPCPSCAEERRQWGARRLTDEAIAIAVDGMPLPDDDARKAADYGVRWARRFYETEPPQQNAAGRKIRRRIEEFAEVLEVINKPEPPADATCETCDAWVRDMDGAYSGACRAEPPVVINVDGVLLSKWPETNQDRWCRHHTQRRKGWG